MKGVNPYQQKNIPLIASAERAQKLNIFGVHIPIPYIRRGNMCNANSAAL